MNELPGDPSARRLVVALSDADRMICTATAESRAMLLDRSVAVLELPLAANADALSRELDAGGLLEPRTVLVLDPHADGLYYRAADAAEAVAAHKLQLGIDVCQVLGATKVS